MCVYFFKYIFKGCEKENCDKNPDQKNQNTALTTFNDINNLNSERRKRNPSEVLPFVGLTDGKLFIVLGLGRQQVFMSNMNKLLQEKPFQADT